MKRVFRSGFSAVVASTLVLAGVYLLNIWIFSDPVEPDGIPRGCPNWKSDDRRYCVCQETDNTGEFECIRENVRIIGADEAVCESSTGRAICID